jgi:hypothetical protein
VQTIFPNVSRNDVAGTYVGCQASVESHENVLGRRGHRHARRGEAGLATWFSLLAHGSLSTPALSHQIIMKRVVVEESVEVAEELAG